MARQTQHPEKKAITADRGRADEPHISDGDFVHVISSRCQGLFSAGDYLQRHQGNGARLTRPLLGLVLSESSQLEELFDAFGARNNSNWYALRELIATAKVFAQTGYILVHLSRSFNRYRLLSVPGNFVRDTEKALSYVRDALANVMRHLLEEAAQRELYTEPAHRENGFFKEDLQQGLLAPDREKRHVASAKQTVLHLTTQFLELAEASAFLHVPDVTDKSRYAAYIPDIISEESLRQLEYRFHNFQSLYDTYLADTDTEAKDTSLPILRGHITIVFHLMEAATNLCHFYERHVLMTTPAADSKRTCVVDPEGLLHICMRYCVLYSSRYLERTCGLCHEILRRYAEISSIEVPVPPYRGFHVRPSTLIAKIVRHYGSEVRMKLLDQVYDAGSPLDLFRANEEINSIKRRRIAEKIAALNLPDQTPGKNHCRRTVRRVVLTLAEENELVIYEHPLPLEKAKPRAQEELSDYVVEEVKRLLALGKIDIESHIAVTFEGDKRVLHDIKLLAESGYGEDRFGNNVTLPSELEYLRQGPATSA